MDFRVDLSGRAQRDIDAIYARLEREQAGGAGVKWFSDLRAAIESLKSLPARCPLAPESRQAPLEVRQLIYGHKPHTYRILFSIQDVAVQVLHIRHTRRRPPTLREVGLE